MVNEQMLYYWNCLPVGKENAITYAELCCRWNCKARKVRYILHELSLLDTDDNYVLIRSSHGKGFYKTDDVQEIERYIKECTNRAINIFTTIKKARRVVKKAE